jgi:hypothetical protein
MATENRPVLYQLHLELVDSEPLIWRRLVVPTELSLEALHPVLVAAMGWSGEADYYFQHQGQRLALATDTQALNQWLHQPNDSLLYTYNPAQGWLHKLTLETLEPENRDRPLSCLAGARRCPPEICDGVWGYDELLERLNDGDDPEYDQLWQTIGYDFDPEAFDVAIADQRVLEVAKSLP